MNPSHVLHAIAGQKALVGTVGAAEELPPFDAVGRVLAHPVFLERAGSGKLVRALGANEDGLVGAVHALEMSRHVTLALEQLVALRTRNGLLE